VVIGVDIEHFYSKTIPKIFREVTAMKPNGPAIKGGCVTRRKHRAESRFFSREIVTVPGGYGTCFCSPGTKFVEHYVCRGTELFASHIFIPIYKFYALQWRGPGLSPVTKLSW
jgi:hypothetical protein